MTNLLGRFRKSVFSISEQEVRCDYRGFHVTEDTARTRIESIGKHFLQGYHSALTFPKHADLNLQLNTVKKEDRGFAYEGATMALAIMDSMSLKKQTALMDFLHGPAQNYTYIAHVGIGWAMARLPWARKRVWARLDPLLRWLAIDGYGFHEGYFNWMRYASGGVGRFKGYAANVFDQGLGRSLWFILGADPARIHTAMQAFSPTRHADLWSGVGLAAAYAGGVEQDKLNQLHQLAKTHQSALAQGVAFAAKAREKAGNPTAHTKLACEILCDMPPEQAAEMTDAALENLPQDDLPTYAHWRARIQADLKQRLAS